MDGRLLVALRPSNGGAHRRHLAHRLDRLTQVVGAGMQQALDYEARAFGELAVTPEARSLVHVFFTSTAAKKPMKTRRTDRSAMAHLPASPAGPAVHPVPLRPSSRDRTPAHPRCSQRHSAQAGELLSGSYRSTFRPPRPVQPGGHGPGDIDLVQSYHIDLVLTPQPQRGAVRDMRSATLDATSVPVGRHLLIPAQGLSPERVLESLAALRHDGVTC